MDNNNSLPEIVSINKLCTLMSISRSRYYQLLSEEIILPPIYSLNSKRPFYTKEMAIRNLEVKKNNIGINNRICIFYNCKSSPIISSPKNNSIKNKSKNTTDKYADLIDGLSSLGLKNIKPSTVEEAVKKCFPDGTDNVEEGEVLRQVFCLIRTQNTTDNVDG